MRWLDDWRARRLSAEEVECRGCRHFKDDPSWLETALPGLTIFSSSHASVRSSDGLCLHHDRLIDGRQRCAGFALRIEEGS